VKIVLVAPKGEENIGAVARACANFEVRTSPHVRQPFLLLCCQHNATLLVLAPAGLGYLLERNTCHAAAAC
jgi:hypothetical protein